MFVNLIRKRYFRNVRAQMRGAKKLRKSGNPYFVLNTIRDLAGVPLGLKSCDFPKILVGSYAANAEIVLRQIY